MAAARLREAGVPVSHLVEDLSPEAASEYAREVDSAWILYAADGGFEVAPVDGDGGFESASFEDVVKMVLGS